MVSRFFQRNSLLLIVIAVYVVVIFRCAWLAEDAFITFRSIDNFINGYGLRWNIAERVQTYTHPLWTLLISSMASFTREIPYTTLAISLATSSLTVCLLAFSVAQSSLGAVVGIAFLICSKSFIDYSTSGLENPLTHLLLVSFIVLYRRPISEQKHLIALAFLSGLVTLNRLDTSLLLLPALGAVWWHQRSWQTARLIALGFTPFFLWELFSLVYYGSPVPNTAYAKLNVGIPVKELIEHGIHYIANSFLLDPLTLIGITVGSIIPFLRPNKRDWPLACGIILYLVYVVRIGGDFMSGRFLSAPFAVAISLMVAHIHFSPLRFFAVISTLAIANFALPRPPLFSNSEYGLHIEEPIDEYRISDERALFYHYTGLVPLLMGKTSEHPWETRARAVRKLGVQYWRDFIHNDKVIREGYLIRQAASGQIVTTWTNIGLSGFYAGPHVHIIDSIALGDPLLAHLPAYENPAWGAGHFGRIMPAGYIETYISGRNEIVDPNLASYCDVLMLITRGELLSWLRLREIWRLNAGYYNDLIDWQAYRFPSELEKRLSNVRIRPENPIYLIDLAKSLFAADEDNKAIAALENALNSNLTSAGNHSSVGVLLLSNGYYLPANKAFAKAIELSADLPSQEVAEFYNGLGASLLHLDHLQEAEAAFLKASVLAEDNWQSHYNIAVINAKLGNGERALTALRESIERGASIQSVLTVGRHLEHFNMQPLYQQLLKRTNLTGEEQRKLQSRVINQPN